VSFYIEHVVTGKRRLSIPKFSLFDIFLSAPSDILFYQHQATNVKINNSVSGSFWKWFYGWKETRDEIYNQKAGSIAVVALDVYANECIFYVSW